MKAVEAAVVKPLKIIIYQRLKTGIFPDKLKIARVVPLFKWWYKVLKLFSNISVTHNLKNRWKNGFIQGCYNISIGIGIGFILDNFKKYWILGIRYF